MLHMAVITSDILKCSTRKRIRLARNWLVIFNFNVRIYMLIKCILYVFVFYALYVPQNGVVAEMQFPQESSASNILQKNKHFLGTLRLFTSWSVNLIFFPIVGGTASQSRATDVIVTTTYVFLLFTCTNCCSDTLHCTKNEKKDILIFPVRPPVSSACWG